MFGCGVLGRWCPGLASPSWHIQLSRHSQGCPWPPEEAPPAVGQQVLERGACREQNVNGSCPGDCGESVWGEPAALGDTQGEGKGRLSPLRACSNDRGCRLRRGGAWAGLRSDLPTWTHEPRGLLRLEQHPAKAISGCPLRGKPHSPANTQERPERPTEGLKTSTLSTRTGREKSQTT